MGYARSSRRVETVLENMFVRNPPGNYDHLLDFNRAVTGSLFFVSTATLLDDVPSDDAPAQAPAASPLETPEASETTPTSSLGTGYLKNDAGHEQSASEAGGVGASRMDTIDA